MVKIYSQGNYFYVVEASGKQYQDFKPNVFVFQDNTIDTNYYVRIGKLTLTYDIGDLADEAGTPYSQATFEAFYTVNSGTSPNGGGLTDAELRATPVPVTGSVTVDTTGLATSDNQDLLLAELELKANLTDTQPVYPATQYEEYSPSDMVTVLSENAKLTTDGSGNLNVRGSVLTDEGSFRDDFSSPLSADWTFTTTGNGTTSQATTIQTVNGGTQAGNTDIKIFTDYSPIIFKKLVQVSQRINNQTIIFGFRDNVNSPNISAEFQLSGTVNTAFNVVTSSSAVSGNSETYSQTVPNAKTTATYLEYEIQVLQNVVAFYVDGILVRSCKIHVPTTGSGSELYAFFRVENTTTVTNTAINVDYVDVANMNLVEVKNEFTSKPLSVQQSGDQHHITSVFTATATTADQNILTFTVPTNRTMYIVGLSIETSNIGGTVKIGKNTITTPAAPGTTDANMFRQFSMQNASATLDSYRAIDFGSFPRIVGSNGDVFRVLITPRGNQPSVWSTTIDYILK